MYMYRMLLTDNAESGELVTPSTRSHGSRGYNNPISNGIPRELYVRCACISHYLSETELIFYVFSIIRTSERPYAVWPLRLRRPTL